MKTQLVKNCRRWLNLFIHYFKQADMTNNAIVMAYYLLLSLPPLLLVLGNLLARLQLKNTDALSYILQLTPVGMSTYLKPIISSFLSQGSNESLSLGIVIAIWSASGMIATLRNAFNKIYQPKRQENPLLLRILSFLLLLLALLMLAALLIFIIFGRYILALAGDSWQKTFSWLLNILQSGNLMGFAGLFLMLFLLNYLVPEQRPKIKYVWIGALFTDTCWFLLIALFHNYVRIFAHSVSTYETIGSFIILMFWLNFSSFFLLLGAVINASCQAYAAPSVDKQDPVKRS